MRELKLKTIGEIGTEAHFFVPSYQRGYRWNRRQVIDLLEDLYTFMQERVGNQFYCLQPIVVRRRDDDHEVIDGQQRLTTISILLQCLGHPAYHVTYETRPKSQRMLASLKDFVEEEATDVDHHYFKEAFLTIQTWMKAKQVDESGVVDSLHTVLAAHTRIIWYEVGEDVDAHELFMRLNIGKIPLTSAELIKASLLEPLPSSERQLLALQWEDMERRLQDDSFWYFLEPAQQYTNRIELLFDLFLGKSIKDEDPLHTFLESEARETFWKETRTMFARLEEWYEDRGMYHLIGYLLHTRSSRSSLGTLVKTYESDAMTTKETFLESLRASVRKTFPDDLEDVRQYRYGTDNARMQDVLLFFNILEEIQSIRDSHRFPFDHYVQEKWSLEHIHARKTEMLKTHRQWTQWLGDVRPWIDPMRQKELLKDVQDLLNRPFGQEEFDDVVSRIEKELDESLMINGEEMHGLGNLALLDRRLNSKLGNHYYPMKFDVLKKHEQDGGYLPPATRKAFWKYYSGTPGHFEYWTSTDQHDYVEFIIRRLKTYFKEDTHVHVHP